MRWYGFAKRPACDFVHHSQTQRNVFVVGEPIGRAVRINLVKILISFGIGVS